MGDTGGTRREHPTQAPCSYLEGDVVLHLMDKVDHFCSQHVTHVKYGRHLCYRFKALILETFRFSEDENDDGYEIFLVVRARGPASIWRENVIAVVILLRVFNSKDRELKQRRRRRQRKRQKRNRFRVAKQQLCTCGTFFCAFLCRCCTTTT